MKKLLLSLLLIPMFLSSQVIWETNFESTKEWSDKGSKNPYSWETRGDYKGKLVGDAYEGKYALSLAALPNKIRNEFNVDGLFKWQTEYWITFAYKIVKPTANLRPFIQMRQAPGSSSNAFSLRCMSDGRVRVDVLTNPKRADAPVKGTGGDGAEFVYAPMTVGKWHLLVMNVNWDYKNGFVKVWVDGNKIIDHEGTTTYRRDSKGQILPGIVYPKIGPYPGKVAAKVGEIHYDAYKVFKGKSTYEKITGKSTSPVEKEEPKDYMTIYLKN